MRLALIGPVYPYRGGIAHYTSVLHKELVASGHAVALFSFARLYPRWLFPGRSDRDPSARYLDTPGHFTLDSLNPWTWRQTARAIQTARPQALIIQWWVPFFAPMCAVLAGLAQRAGIRVIFICHNVLPHEPRPWDRPLARWALSHGDGFVVASAAEEGALHALVGKRPGAIAPHPVNALFAGEAIPPARARQHLRLPADAPVLLFFGFVRPYKGLDCLLAAMPEIKRQVPGVRLLVVGEFWQDKAPYLQQIAHLGLAEDVRIVDRYVTNEEAGTYFSAANLAVLPYAHATQSGVVQLAFGFGLPVLTTRVGSLPDVVADGETGLLVPPGDSQALAAAIIRYLTGDMEPAMRRCLAEAGRRASWDTLIQAVVRLAEG